MGSLFAELLPEMVGLIVTPGAVAGCTLLLHSSRPVRNPVAFGSAFLLVYTLIAISALLGGASEPGATSQDTAHSAGLVVGLIFLAAGSWIAVHPTGPVASTPKWLTALQSAGPGRAFVVGLGFAIINPNLFIIVSGMSVISSSHVGPGAALLAAVLLLVAAALDFLIPIAIYLVLGERAKQAMDSVQAWMIRNSRNLTLGVLFVFGALFTIRGVLDLS